MGNTEKYQVNYWAGDNDYVYQTQKPKRSIKRKLAIVFSFIFVLAITPTLIYALTNLNLSSGKKVSIAPQEVRTENQTQPQEAKPEVHQVTIEEPKKAANQTEVLEHDSYWKISKRVCGTGKYYLSVQNQNGSKALYFGDTVTVSCVL
jgi:hypothetical protein